MLAEAALASSKLSNEAILALERRRDALMKEMKPCHKEAK